MNRCFHPVETWGNLHHLYAWEAVFSDTWVDIRADSEEISDHLWISDGIFHVLWNSNDYFWDFNLGVEFVARKYSLWKFLRDYIDWKLSNFRLFLKLFLTGLTETLPDILKVSQKALKISEDW